MHVVPHVRTNTCMHMYTCTYACTCTRMDARTDMLHADTHMHTAHAHAHTFVRLCTLMRVHVHT